MAFFISIGKINKQFIFLIGFIIFSIPICISSFFDFLNLSFVIYKMEEGLSQTLLIIPYLIYNKCCIKKHNKKYEINRQNGIKDLIILILIIFLDLINVLFDLFYDHIFKYFFFSKIN